jgi:hypothetical protein
MEHKKRVAVIAVHGVADQQQQDSAKQAADLLLHSQSNGYSWLGQSVVRIPVEAVSTEFEGLGKSGPRKKEGEATYLSETLRQAIQREPEIALSEETTPEATQKELEERRKRAEIPLEVCDMREMLLWYKPSDADVTYETPRIDLRRRSGCECHVFEMFWADLSRLQTKVIGTLVAFYQLLFFVCDLGTRTIHYARANYAKGNLWWRAFDRTHFIAHLILVLGIPILNLALFGLAIAAVASGYYQKLNLSEPVAALILGGVLAGIGAYFFIRDQSTPVHSWPGKFFVVLGAFLLPLAFVPVLDLGRWVPMMTWLIMALVIYWLMTVYERRRGGAKKCGVFILVLTTGVFGGQLHQLSWPSDWLLIFKAGIDTLDAAIFYGHWPLWIGFAVFTLVCWLVSVAAVRLSGQSDKDKDHAWRAAVTAKISLAIPGVLVLIVDLGLWQLLVSGLDKLPGNLINKCQQAVANQVFLLSVPIGTAFGLILFLVAALFVLWLFLPAVIAEGDPQRIAEGYPPKGPTDPSRLGHILSASFRHLKWSGWAFQLLITIGLLTSVVLWATGFNQHDVDAQVVVALSVALFLLFTFRGAGKTIRSVLDVILDVANWLRHDPPGRTPRARICARFASLLRYICNWRDPESAAPYDAIVILSHSQGTVITADLFRYLKHVPEPGLERIFRTKEKSERLPVYLFTMGCPLRQLYALRFPDQYAWAHDTAAWDDATRPNPDDLCVEHWSNFYRSGDYVGRVLWHPDADQSDAPWDNKVRENVKRRESCIGIGAHTHYWDETAPQIADELDDLIEKACKR